MIIFYLYMTFKISPTHNDIHPLTKLDKMEILHTRNSTSPNYSRGRLYNVIKFQYTQV